MNDLTKYALDVCCRSPLTTGDLQKGAHILLMTGLWSGNILGQVGIVRNVAWIGETAHYERLVDVLMMHPAQVEIATKTSYFNKGYMVFKIDPRGDLLTEPEHEATYLLGDVLRLPAARNTHVTYQDCWLECEWTKDERKHSSIDEASAENLFKLYRILSRPNFVIDEHTKVFQHLAGEHMRIKQYIPEGPLGSFTLPNLWGINEEEYSRLTQKESG